MLLECREIEVVEILVVVSPILFPCVRRFTRVASSRTISITAGSEAKGWRGKVIEVIRVMMDMSRRCSALEVLGAVSREKALAIEFNTTNISTRQR